MKLSKRLLALIPPVILLVEVKTLKKLAHTQMKELEELYQAKDLFKIMDFNKLFNPSLGESGVYNRLVCIFF